MTFPNVLKYLPYLPALATLILVASTAHGDLLDEVEHGYADNNGVKIHYATVGEGPLVIMIHGFPDYWYSWRHQMEGLKDNFKVVAIDQRGYNLSGQPEAESSYAMSNLIGDVAAVIRHFGEEKANIVGHDWGGIVSWQFAFALPEMVENLVILNLPIPMAWRENWLTTRNSRITVVMPALSLPAKLPTRTSSSASP